MRLHLLRGWVRGEGAIAQEARIHVQYAGGRKPTKFFERREDGHQYCLLRPPPIHQVEGFGLSVEGTQQRSLILVMLVMAGAIEYGVDDLGVVEIADACLSKAA